MGSPCDTVRAAYCKCLTDLWADVVSKLGSVRVVGGEDDGEIHARERSEENRNPEQRFGQDELASAERPLSEDV